MRSLRPARGPRMFAATLGLALLPFLLLGCIEVTLDGSGSRVTPPPSGTAPAGEVLDLEKNVTLQINEIREEEGLDPLSERDDLIEIARKYSCRMAEEDFFAHESPDGGTVADRSAEYGVEYRYLGENLAYHTGASPEPDRVVDGWMDSEGHRENILREEYTQTGIGACQGDGTWYYTQVFLRPR